MAGVRAGGAAMTHHHAWRRRAARAERARVARAERERVVTELRQLEDRVDIGLTIFELLEAVAWRDVIALHPGVRPPWRRQAPDPVRP